MPCDKVNHRPAVTAFLRIRADGEVLDLKHPFALIRDDDDGEGLFPFPHREHLAALQIPVDHAFLLVRQQKQREVILLLTLDLNDFHPVLRSFCRSFLPI